MCILAVTVEAWSRTGKSNC